MELSEIQTQFCEMAQITTQEAAQYGGLLSATLARINQAVEGRTLSQTQKTLLCRAAAALAYRELVTLQIAAEPSFSAGDVSVTQQSSRLQAAKELAQQALTPVRELLGESDFSFLRVVS